MPRATFGVRQRLALRGSPIHGRGVFARVFIPAGTRLIEYRGERVSPEEGDERYIFYPERGETPHTFLFKVDDETVVDGGVRGNMARWINHSCDPNCEALIEDGRIYVDSLRDIAPGEELTYDYQLIVEERQTASVKRRYPCACGTARCRGTLLARKR
jgi:SET domain-containing protein